MVAVVEKLRRGRSSQLMLTSEDIVGRLEVIPMACLSLLERLPSLLLESRLSNAALEKVRVNCVV
jgi:hypothetical protein